MLLGTEYKKKFLDLVLVPISIVLLDPRYNILGPPDLHCIAEIKYINARYYVSFVHLQS